MGADDAKNRRGRQKLSKRLEGTLYSMPIAFTSNSHGRIPFGFFNIETDMLLMDRYFFFSTDFCDWLMEWSNTEDLQQDEKTVYVIQDADRIGNLAGAIYGFEFSGFIGAVYRLFPFPDSRAGFRQKPYGVKNRSKIESMIQSYAVENRIVIRFSRSSRTISFGDYVFSASVFRELIRYVEGGGMPGWLNGKAPDYVGNMLKHLKTAAHPLLSIRAEE